MTQSNDRPKSAPKGDKNAARWVAAGAAMGIGSAALVAALLYANRGKAADADEPAPPPFGPAPESD